MNIKGIQYRLKRDLISRNHFHHYKKNLSHLKNKNYNFYTLREVYSNPKYENMVGLRHDVDINDPVGNFMFYNIEKSIGAKSTFYFRLSTIKKHKKLIKNLIQDNFEVGYHFEEPASFMKKNKIKSLNELRKNKHEIQDHLSQNILKFENIINKKIDSICAHGDWINRVYNFTNSEFISQKFLDVNNIKFEAYDDKLKNLFDYYLTDTSSFNTIWKNDYSPINASDESYKKLYILTHERTFHLERKSSWESNIKTLYEKILFR
tara:strand:- start:4135 stop:4923 length:789 start_codon:yes stop_codon:yes gene_type:complete